ncbi:MAG TPA: CHAT domain-containing protein [Chloroflexia bacterium]|nr:CHAT domain-containing protein [Chloroflexia bacterium]
MSPSGTSGAIPPRGSRKAIDIEWFHPAYPVVFIEGQPFDVTYKEKDVDNLNKRFIEALEKIRLKVMKQGRDLEPLADGDYLACRESLKTVGEDAFGRLPRGLWQALLGQEADLQDLGEETSISLDITFPPGMALLWEMVYTGNQADSFARGQEEQFWGFRYPIGHLYSPNRLKGLVKLQSGVFASAHAGLQHSEAELQQIEAKLREIGAALNLPISLQRLEEAISNEELTGPGKVLELFNREDFAYGMIHLACHCATPDAEDVSQSFLTITAHQREVAMILAKFENFIQRQGSGFRAKYRPLIFLNACESGTPLQLLQSQSFPKSLIDFGANGVIATACRMPDNFAYAFATEFYRRLLEKPQTKPYIGEVLLDTRLHFLHEYQNPLGLAYGLYSGTDQRLLVD